mgnify:CR=1 FL=1
MGYDVHKLVEGRDLILGGVKIPHTLGLLGHSDADVLLHAIMDALLGAAALGDIGKHFPDTDPQYKGISSIKLLEHVAKLIEEKGYIVENIDATIIAQKPKMRPYIEEMEKNILLTYTKLYRAYEEQKKYVPEGNLFEVKFEDFEADAFGTTKLAYEKLGIREFDCAEAAIRQYTDRKKGYKKNKYEYKPRTIQLVNENWGYALKDWDYEIHP